MKAMFDFDTPVNRRQFSTRKWQDAGMMDEDTLPFWVADSDFACHRPIVDALIRRAEHPCYGYTLLDDAVLDSVCNFWQRRHRVTVQKQDIVLLPSVVSGLRAVVQALTRAHDRVAVFTPVYGPFYTAVNESERTLVDIPLLKDEAYRYHLDFAALEAAMQEGLALVMLCSPHNPVGRQWSEDELTRLCALCARYKVRLAVDEIHCDYALDHPFVSIFSIANAPQDTVLFSAPSKTFNVAGLKQAYLFCREEATRTLLARFIEHSGAESANIFGLTAMQAAYETGDAWLDAMIAYLRESRAIMRRFFQKNLPLAKVTPLEATYLAWVDVSAYESDDDAITAKMRRHNVSLTAGPFFGKAGGHSHIRINLACPHEQLDEGLRRIQAALLDNA